MADATEASSGPDDGLPALERPTAAAVEDSSLPADEEGADGRPTAAATLASFGPLATGVREVCLTTIGLGRALPAFSSSACESSDGGAYLRTPML